MFWRIKMVSNIVLNNDIENLFYENNLLYTFGV